MTKKLFWDNPYDTHFEAEIIGIDEDGIILDRTLFYPDGGNQISDKGVILKQGNIFQVKHISKRNNKIIHHISEPFGENLKIGDNIEGEIDWNYRYGVMRAHSSQHIISALIKNKFNIDTAHATISFEDVSLQIARTISDDQFKEVITEFNRICTIENHEFQTRVVQRDEIGNNEKYIRGKIPEQGRVRLVELKNYDLICCGGTHVRNTTEIGPVLVYEFNKGTNFKFIVGSKALNQLTTDNYRILNYARNLNLPALDMVENFQKQLDKKLIVQRNYEILAITVLQLVSQNPKKILNNLKIGIIRMDVDYKTIQKSFRDFPKDYLLLILEENNKIRILSNTEKANANHVLQKLLKKFGGKGGGSPFSAQATLRDEPRDIILELEL